MLCQILIHETQTLSFLSFFLKLYAIVDICKKKYLYFVAKKETFRYEGRYNRVKIKSISLIKLTNDWKSTIIKKKIRKVICTNSILTAFFFPLRAGLKLGNTVFDKQIINKYFSYAVSKFSYVVLECKSLYSYK